MSRARWVTSRMIDSNSGWRPQTERRSRGPEQLASGRNPPSAVRPPPSAIPIGSILSNDSAPDASSRSDTSGGVGRQSDQHRWAPEWATVVVLVAIVSLPVWPGVHTVDSQALLRSALEGQISNWYSPLHGWGWGLTDRVGMPPGTVLVLSTTVFVAATLATFRLWFGRGAALVATGAIVMFPPVYGMLGWAGRDNWYMAETMVVIAAVGWSRRRPDRRTILLGTAVASSLVAFDARQNGVVLIVVVAGFAAWSIRHLGSRRKWPAMAVGVVLASMMGLIGVVAVQAAQSVVMSVQQYPEQPLYYYDVIGTSVQTGAVLVPATLYPSQNLAGLTDRFLIDYAVLDTNDSHPDALVYRPYADGAAVTAEIRTAWRRVVRTETGSYLAVRARLYGRQIGLTAPTSSVFYSWTDDVGWSGAERLEQSFPTLNRARVDLLHRVGDDRGNGSGLHDPWIYLVAGLIAVAVIWAKDAAQRPLAAVIGAILLLSQFIIVFASPATNFRYQLPSIVLSLVVSVAAIVTHTRERKHRSGRGEIEAARDEPFAEAVRS